MASRTSVKASNEVGLKKPIGVYILAILFIIAPLGNILISFAGAGVSNWYEPSIFFVFLQSIPLFDWVWLTLLFVAGVSLFRPHKLSWSFAIATLLFILCLNAYRMFYADMSSITPQYLKVFSILALFCTFGVLIIAFYFRFPYLDRRANWIKNIERFNLKTEVQINQMKLLTDSVSVTGCRIITQESINLKPNETVQLQFTEIHTLPVNCTVIDSTDKHVRLEFASGQEVFVGKLKSWLRTKTGS